MDQSLMTEVDLTKVIDYSGKDILPVANIDNQGWSEAEKELKVHHFRDRRTHAPKPLSLNKNTIFGEKNFPVRLIMNHPPPVFDWGLGCFGNPTKLVDSGKEELVEMDWIDFHETRIARELFNGERSWNGDDDWIRLQRLYQRGGGEAKSELDLIEFHEGEQVSRNDHFEEDKAPAQPRTPEAEEFLSALGDVESAHPEAVGEMRTIPTSVQKENATWKLQNFRDWIEEADFVEANACTPNGTRYYNTPDNSWI